MSQPDKPTEKSETPSFPGSVRPPKESTPDTREAFERGEKALEAVNQATGTVRNLYITFLLLGTYIGVIIASTTDEQLLRISPVTLPLLNVELPILGFYIVVPWLFLLLHFDLLLQLVLLGKKLNWFNEVSGDLPKTEADNLQRRLSGFPFVHMLISQHQDRFIQSVMALIVGSTVIALPLVLLLWAQLAFLPYHNPIITWWQRLAITVDAVLLVLFWFRIMPPQSIMNWWKEHLRSLLVWPIWLLVWAWAAICRIARRPWKKPPGVRTVWRESQTGISNNAEFLISVVLVIFLASLLIDAVAERGLDLREKVLTNNDLSAEVINTLREGEIEQKKEALRKVLGINLQGRDLRYADLFRGILPKADLREANLRGANLHEAQLQGADLSGANLQGADLSMAQLQGTVLRDASIGGANFKDARLDLADLRHLDRGVLTKEKYRQSSEDLEREVDDAGIRAAILERIEAVIGREDTLNQAEDVKKGKPCLSDVPKPFANCLTEDQSDQYDKALVPYLVEELACGNPYVARGVAWRAKGGMADLAVALPKADCAAVKELPENREVIFGEGRVVYR